MYFYHSCKNSGWVGLGPHFGDKPQNLEWGCEVGAAPVVFWYS